MYSLLLKDFYILFNNAKAFIGMLLVFAFAFIPSSGYLAYIVAAGIMSSMMVVTTFSYDERSKWHRYALIMPLSRQQIVRGKFILLLLCSLIGLGLASVICLVAVPVSNLFHFRLNLEFQPLMVTLLAGLSLSVIYGSVSIPLLFKFGAEKARMLTLLSFLIPSSIGFLVIEVIKRLGLTLSDQLVLMFILFSPLIALLWLLPLYGLSIAIFKGQEDV